MINLPTSIIAEIGENHIGDIDLAKKMITDAAKSGANIVKFQSYRGRDSMRMILKGIGLPGLNCLTRPILS